MTMMGMGVAATGLKNQGPSPRNNNINGTEHLDSNVGTYSKTPQHSSFVIDQAT